MPCQNKKDNELIHRTINVIPKRSIYFFLIKMITESLPETVKEMVEIIGLTSALALVALRGGEQLAIPKKCNPNHWLQEAIGVDAFNKMVKYYSGETFEIPRCCKAIRAVTHHHIIEESEQGVSSALLARRHGYTQRGIRKIINSN